MNWPYPTLTTPEAAQRKLEPLTEAPVPATLESSEPLDQIEDRLRDVGVTITRPTTDEGSGRQLQLASLDGLLLKIDELQPELYT